MDAKIMALNALRRVGSASTGGEIWKFLNDTCENYEDRKFLKSNFPAEDQNIREILTELVKKGLAASSVRVNTALIEYKPLNWIANVS
jgi:hypothetical protein